MADIIPLPVWPRKPTGPDLDLIKQAKSSLSYPHLIQPVDAVPGSPGIILALRERPNFICDHAFVQNVTLESITAALKHCLGLTDDSRGTTVTMMLKEVFGEELKEIEVTD
ncbi:MAG: hypothetical protein EBU08_12235 [Micrococcales bacterium]|nr:hypothetical protein [Micrococcales bacterium]